jgi:uncharacterized protein YjbI with pentapeptide repeats
MDEFPERYYFSRGADAATVSLLALGAESWNRARQGRLHTSRPHLNATPTLFANLGNADLRARDLTGIDFSRISLHQASLDESCLAYASLVDSHLEHASFRGANLLCADLSIVYADGARFDGADLRWSKIDGALRGASFAGADLRLATLSGDLTGADFQGAHFGRTSLLEVRGLREVEGLSSVLHDAPSVISNAALQDSNGFISRSFLRGCGLADWQIEVVKLYDPSLSEEQRTLIAYEILRLQTGPAFNVAPVFISYSHQDGVFVDRIATELDTRGVRYWRDTKHATSGRIDEVIDRGLRLNEVLLLVLSESSLASRWVEMELTYALNRGLKLCPVALDSSWKSARRLSADLIVQLKKYMILDFSQWKDPACFAEQCGKLFEGLGAHYSPRSEPR